MSGNDKVKCNPKGSRNLYTSIELQIVALAYWENMGTISFPQAATHAFYKRLIYLI